jgi:hypothetical protein
MSACVPAYRLYRATGQAVVEIRGQRTFLGECDSLSSHERFRQITADPLSSTATEFAPLCEIALPATS